MVKPHQKHQKTLVLSPWYQLLSEATPITIVDTQGTIKVLLPENQVYKCFFDTEQLCNSKLSTYSIYFPYVIFLNHYKKI